MSEMVPGWYRRGEERERFHDGTQFTGQTRAMREKTEDRFPLFIWEDGEMLPGLPQYGYGYGSSMKQYKRPGWRQATFSRFSLVVYSIMALVIAAFGLWLALQ